MFVSRFIESSAGYEIYYSVCVFVFVWDEGVFMASRELLSAFYVTVRDGTLPVYMSVRTTEGFGLVGCSGLPRGARSAVSSEAVVIHGVQVRFILSIFILVVAVSY